MQRKCVDPIFKFFQLLTGKNEKVFIGFLSDATSSEKTILPSPSLYPMKYSKSHYRVLNIGGILILTDLLAVVFAISMIIYFKINQKDIDNFHSRNLRLKKIVNDSYELLVKEIHRYEEDTRRLKNKIEKLISISD